MDTGIGPTLREARNRRKVDLPEVEAAIKIRIRYLQAIENEEWDALPGGAYARGFIRTYANYLGLDGDRLADDFRRSTATPGAEHAPKRVEPVPTSVRRPRPRLSGRLLVAGVCLVLVAAVVGIALAGGGGSGSSSNSPAIQGKGEPGGEQTGKPAAAARPGVAIRLAATGEVWVCLLGADRKPLVDGEILEEGAEAGPFRSAGYELALGNGSVKMTVDGKPAAIPPSSSPVGYAIDESGKLATLEEGERPSCE